MTFRAVLSAGVAACLATQPLYAGAPEASAKPVPVADLIRSIDLPYQQFTLPNGLRVVVHTDRKAPLVSVGIWYDVGSKHEPKGATGFAHLFEHLMFNGSENAPGDFIQRLKDLGATDYNGSTSSDFTNYYETVPTGALERLLFLESDRMGYLAGAISQSVLNEQRGVVQNEKRLRDTAPQGLTYYRVLERLYPAGHPYAHAPIGSMADLDRAGVDTVRTWFKDHYGPNNAVLAFAGDIDVATAKTLAAKYFGPIPAGPRNSPPAAPVPVLRAPIAETMKDRVPHTIITRTWSVPGTQDMADAAALSIIEDVLGGEETGRLSTTLVRRDRLASRASAYLTPYQQVGTFTINVVLQDEKDADKVNRALDTILAEFVRSGPTADEVARVVMSTATQRIKSLESVDDQQRTLAVGALRANDPGEYKRRLAVLAAQTPATVRAAAAKWLTRPAYALTIVPGPRDAYAEAKAVTAAQATPVPPAPISANASAPMPTRAPMPPLRSNPPVTFPPVARARLSNGAELFYAQRAAVPMTWMSVQFDAGSMVDVDAKLGTEAVTLKLMQEGSAELRGTERAAALERLGARVSAWQGTETTAFGLNVPSANLAPGVALLADALRRPAFAEDDIARLKQEQIALIQDEKSYPDGLAGRMFERLINPGSPLSKVPGEGDPVAIAKLGKADLVAFRNAWLRPDRMKVFVVSSLPLTTVRATLDAALGDWTATGPAGTKPPIPQRTVPAARIVLVDQPDSPQSLIWGGMVSPVQGDSQTIPLDVGNDGLGGDFNSRINQTIRQQKQWAYGASGDFQHGRHVTPYVVTTSVQQDKTGAAIEELRRLISEYVTTKPMTQAEFDRAVHASIDALPGRYASAANVLGAIQSNDTYGRPDDYPVTLAGRYRAQTLPGVRDAMRRAIDPARFVWLVVGDAKVVRPQLEALGLPVEDMAPQ